MSGMEKQVSVTFDRLVVSTASSIFPGGHVHELRRDCCGIKDCGRVYGIQLSGWGWIAIVVNGIVCSTPIAD